MSQTMETFQQVLDQTQYGSANPILQANLWKLRARPKRAPVST